MLPSLKNIGALAGKRVLVRADFNVPVSEGVVAPGADWRLKVVLPTLEFLSNEGAKIIILAHLGRPKNHDLSCSLYPIFLKLVELWRPGKLFFSTDILGERVEKQIAKLKNGEAILL
ncbi:MAG: phosphoglycerate kinase, partial [Patescibacteria group bacterium]